MTTSIFYDVYQWRKSLVSKTVTWKSNGVFIESDTFNHKIIYSRIKSINRKFSTTFQCKGLVINDIEIPESLLIETNLHDFCNTLLNHVNRLTPPKEYKRSRPANHLTH